MEKLIYLADDEAHIRQLMKTFLENEGYRVQLFADGPSIRRAFDAQAPDLIILDVMMPGEDGLSICSYIRSRSSVPILIVSARDTPLDRVAGITLGSDDYLSKPFLPLELTARVKALFRRAQLSSQPDSRPVSCGNLTLNPASHTIQIRQQPFSATPTEYAFLSYLVNRAGLAVSKKELLKAVWNYPDPGDSRVIDDLIKRLRRKMREAGSSAIVETIWGYGYRLNACQETPAEDTQS